MTRRVRTTVAMDPEVHAGLQERAAATGRSMSSFVNRAVAIALADDIEDLQAFDDRADESVVDWEHFLKALGRDRG